MSQPAVAVVRKVLGMVDAGLVDPSVFDQALRGMVFVTPKGVGTYREGMLVVEGRVETLNIPSISGVHLLGS
jgi:hypothetical protein